MRASFALILAIAACTGTITGGGGGDHSNLSTRVGDACAELSSACTNGLDCIGQSAFCGPIQSQISVFFTAESACKGACTDTSCQKDCKLQRVTGINAILAMTSIDGGNTIGTGLNACPTMQQTCSDSGSGCGATEFFCTLAAPVQDACYQQLVLCKQACGHNHTCKYQCKQAYLQCEAMGSGSGTTPDAGVPDAPTTTPDAPTATPDAPTTTTNYTYTNDIKNVTTNFCSGCHSGASAPGGYLTDTYLHLFGNGSDNTPNIIAGDATSLFVTKIQGDHHNVLTIYPGFDQVAYDWVVHNNAQQ